MKETLLALIQYASRKVDTDYDHAELWQDIIKKLIEIAVILTDNGLE